jgi:putative oxidoreductase
MNSSISKDMALLILRLAGLMLAFAHGWAKVDQLVWGDATRRLESIAGLGFPMPGFFAWCLALTEFGGGLLIASGLFTRIVASFAAFAMAVATFLQHRLHLHVLIALGMLSVPEETVDRWGDPERAFLFLLIMLALVLMGAGRLSLDHVFGKKRRK